MTTQVITSPGVMERAMQAILDAHKVIRVTNGYNSDVAYFSRHVRNPMSLTVEKTPAIMVARNPNFRGEIKTMGRDEYGQKVRVEIVGVVRGPDGVDPDEYGLATRAEALLSDIKALHLADATYGLREAIGTSYIVDDYNDVGWEVPGALVAIGIEALITWEGSGP